MLKCAFWYRVLHGTEIVRNCYAWDADASKQINTNQQKGVINAEDINILSSPTQLKHDGFFRFLTCSDDVNSQTDEGAHKFTAHTVGDFYAFLVGNQATSSGCRYGTFIVTSPRLVGTFWIARIWEYKFTGWYEFK